jgi:hypothetical protein
LPTNLSECLQHIFHGLVVYVFVTVRFYCISINLEIYCLYCIYCIYYIYCIYSTVSTTVNWSIYLSIHLSFYLSIFLSFFISIFLSFYLSIFLSFYPSIHPYFEPQDIGRHSVSQLFYLFAHLIFSLPILSPFWLLYCSSHNCCCICP